MFRKFVSVIHDITDFYVQVFHLVIYSFKFKIDSSLMQENFKKIIIFKKTPQTMATTSFQCI